MKPKINLASPHVKSMMQTFGKEIQRALDAPQKVESAVIPILAILKTKAHRSPKTKPEQIGSGVLVKIENEYFIFGATHVFLEHGIHQIITSTLGDNVVQSLAGERFCTGKLNSPKNDIYDASVFHIQSYMSKELQDMALTPDSFDLSDSYDSSSIYMASGFRIKKSNTSGNIVKMKRESFPSIRYDLKDQLQLGFNPETHIVLAYENQGLMGGRWVTTPRPTGVSGGAIMRIEGTDIRSPNNRNQNPTQLLSAITIEQHRDKPNKPGILVGTRIKMHLGLIQQFLPDLLK